MDILKKNFLFYHNNPKYDKEYVDVPYMERVQKINGNVFRKFFIIDIRNFDDLELEIIFKDYKTFQDKFFGKEFCFYEKCDFSYRYNMMLYFIYDEQKQYKFSFDEIKYDFSYVYKNFVSKNDINKVLLNDILLKERDVIASYKGKQITNGFNLIYGPNGSGKTLLLNELADKLNTEVFNLNKDSNLEDYIHQKLLNYFGLSKNCINDSQKYFYNLSKILTYCSRNDLPILLDDLCWNSLNIRDQIKLVDILFDYSRAQETVITTCKNDVKELVKKRVYMPNIIDLK